MSCVVFAGVLTHLPAGPPLPATVVLAGGRIAQIGLGPELVVTDESATFRGEACALRRGGELTAGLVAVPTQLGVVGIDLEQGTHDADPAGDDGVRASLRVVDAYDPFSVVLPVQRIEGVTHAVVTPTGGWVSGFGGFVQIAGGSQAAAVLDREAVMVGSAPSRSFADGLRQWSELLDDARAYAKSPALYDAGRPGTAGASRADLEALGALLRREVRLLVGVDAAHELEALVRWSAAEEVDVVVSGGAEAWQVAGALAAAKVPVIVDPLVVGPGGFDQLSGRADNARLLDEAGVPVILSAFSTHNARTLRQVAGNAVRAGMDPVRALRAITATPAAVFGQRELGELRIGAVASVVHWSGDPLELSTRALGVWVGGEAVGLRSRQTELFEKYRSLPGLPLPPLPLPGAR